MSSNELKSTPVSQSLDKKMLIMGFEIPDLLFIFLTMSTLNFFFGTSDLKWLLVWIPSLSLATIFRITKKGKPDNYLIHWLRFQIKPGILKAFQDSPDSQKFYNLKRKIK